MKKLHTVVWKEDAFFMAKFLELELASQGKTKREALANLREALDLYLEDEDVNKLFIPVIQNITTQTIFL